MSSIPGISQSLQYAQAPTSSTASFVSTSQVAVVESDVEVAQASVSLSANLNNVTAATGTGQLTLEFARALQGATEVDPATGQREIIAGANAQLTTTLNSLLVQSGFSSAQASDATADLATELAQGGPITLTASYDQSTQNSASTASIYSSGAASSISAVDATDRSGSITIGINLDTGELNLSLSAQSSSAYASSGKITGLGALSAPVGQFLTLPSGAGSPSGTTQSDFGQVLSNQSLLSLADNPFGTPSLSTASGFGTASANSPLSEGETDTYAALEQVTLTLTDYSSTTNSGANSGSNSDSSGSAAGGPGPDTAATVFSFEGVVSGSGSYAASSPDTVGTGSNASAGDTLKQLLAELNQTTLLAQKEAATLLQGLSDISAQAKAAAQAKQTAAVTTAAATSAASSFASVSAASAAAFSVSVSSAASASSAAADSSSGSPALTGGGRGSGGAVSNSVSIEIGISQTISLQRLDANGYGDTLYKRPDGSLGKISTQPTHVTA
jgi:hypothetical protein